MNRIRNALLALWRDQRGLALPLALLALLVLVAQSSALLVVGSSEIQIAANLRASTQALFLAEAGLEDAFNTIRNTPSLITSAPASLTVMTALSGSGKMGSFGSYSVQYQSAGPNTVLVVATGMAGAAQKTLRATLSTQFTTNDAFRTNGDLTISGNPTFTGACGKAHTNRDLTISGSPSFAGTVTAAGSYAGDPTLGQGGQIKKMVPTIGPATFLASAQQTLPASQIFQMKSLSLGPTSMGLVLDGAGLLITTLTEGQSYRGWKYSSGTPASWDYNDSTANDGTYYFEGNAKVSGSPGSNATPWKTTILSTGNIEVSGKPTMSSHLTDTLLVAGQDITITGNPTQSASGIIVAHEQIKISGKPTIQGYLVAENATSTGNTVVEDVLTGTLTITFDCGLTPPLQGPLQILAWGL